MEAYRSRPDIIEREREYRLKRNDLDPTRSKRWNDNNRERYRKYHRDYYYRNKSSHRKRNAAWKKKYPEKVLSIKQRRRARESGAVGYHTSTDIASKITNQNGRCYWCCVMLNGRYDLDHIMPLILGGSDWPDNLAVTCIHCNRSKARRHPLDFVCTLFR